MTEDRGRNEPLRVRRVGPLVLRAFPPDHPTADLEVAITTVGLLVVLVLAFLPLEPLVRLLPPCTFHRLTGHPCLTCGTTRLLLALARGHVGEALAWNPLVAAGLLAFLAWTPVAAVQWLFRLPRWRIGFGSARARWIAAAAFAVLLALDWAYVAWRGV